MAENVIPMGEWVSSTGKSGPETIPSVSFSGGGGGGMDRIDALEKSVERLDRRFDGLERRMDDGFRDTRRMASDISSLTAQFVDMSASIKLMARDVSDKPGKAYVWTAMSGVGSLLALVIFGGGWFLWSNLATIIAALQALQAAAH